jgi:hypothetical protein
MRLGKRILEYDRPLERTRRPMRRRRASRRVIAIDLQSNGVGYVNWMVEAEFEIQILHLQPSAAAPREPCLPTKE